MKTILLVEDEPILSMITSRIVNSFGYEVVSASNGERAVETAIANGKVDLILMDIDLGKGIDGTEAAKKILERKNIPIVFLTSHSEKEYVDKVKKITRYGYVIKNSGNFVLQSSIEMAFELFDAHRSCMSGNNVLKTDADESMSAMAIRESQNRFKAISTIEHNPVIIADQDGNITYCSPVTEEVFGFSSVELMGRNINQIIISDNPEDDVLPFNFHIVGDEPIIGNICEFTAIRKNGNKFPIKLSFSAMKEKDSWMAVVIIRDISEQKQIQSLLKEKELLLREVHHRIKNNMAVIGGILMLQANSTKNIVAVNALNDAQGRLHSMSVLYDKLYRSENFNEVSVKPYLEKLVDEIFFVIPESTQIEVKKNISDFIVDANKIFAIGLIVNELLTNIAKYAFKGRDSGTLCVSGSRNDKTVIICVEDNGIGLPEGIDIKKSTGFGLSLVGIMAEQIKGTIRIERNNGTKFILNFPI